MRPVSAWTALAVLITLAPPVLAQDRPPEGEGAAAASPRFGCLQGAPRPRCGSFWLLELQASTTLVEPSWEVGGVESGSYRVDEGGAQYEWSLGHMANLDDRWAIGGTVSLGSGADDVFTGMRARLRRWIGSAASVEFETGLARSNGDHNWYPAQTGITAGLRFNVLDYGAVFLRYDGYGEPSERPWAGPGVEALPGGSRHFLRGGVGLGGKATLVGTGAVGVIYGVLLAVLLADEGYR